MKRRKGIEHRGPPVLPETMIRQILSNCEAQIAPLAARLQALHSCLMFFTGELQWYIDHPGEKSPWEIKPPDQEPKGVK